MKSFENFWWLACVDKVVILLLPMGHWSATGSLCSFAESKKAAKREYFFFANTLLIEIETLVKVRLWRKLLKINVRKRQKTPNVWLFVIPRDENTVTYGSIRAVTLFYICLMVKDWPKKRYGISSILRRAQCLFAQRNGMLAVVTHQLFMTTGKTKKRILWKREQECWCCSIVFNMYHRVEFRQLLLNIRIVINMEFGTVMFCTVLPCIYSEGLSKST